MTGRRREPRIGAIPTRAVDDRTVAIETAADGNAVFTVCRQAHAMDPIAATVVQMQAASLSQGVGTAVARQQIAAERSVADLVAAGAASAAPPAPPGQGERVDVRV